MPTVTFIEHDGTPHTVEAETGLPLMRVAVEHSVPGIDADCGGECACATCHVLVEEQWLEVVGPPGDVEDSMLSQHPDRQSNSRLSCQIPVRETLEGLVVRLPEFQF
ncbi:MAG TPA: 2Fe-2S iron-sulfur cluster-binding protein [Gammaproteobacteria bacterium]|nr:2Fe-2S iron-sulfur cluster-binding protein [Gammaproteobacteria bacterium]